MQIIPLHPGDKIQLKKAHPCGEKTFRVMRVGSVVRIVCQGCGRDMNMDRIKLEKAILRILESETDQTKKGND